MCVCALLPFPPQGVTVAPPGQYVQVSCHTDECCGVRTDGRLLCWGGFTPEGAGFVMHGEQDRFTQVSVGNNFFCAIKVRARPAAP